MLRNLALALLCFAAGSLSHLAMAPYNLAPVLFIGLPALFFALQRTDKKKIYFLYTWLFSFGYFVFSLSWISNALLVPGNESFLWAYPLALCGLPALLALFPAFTISFFAGRYDLEHLSGWFAFVTALVLSEVARGFLFTGFPWNNFAYAWAGVLPVAQVVSFGGLYFLTILTIFWASTPALYFLHKRDTSVLIIFVLSALTFTGSYFWGLHRIKTEEVYGTPEIMVHMIQPNVAQQDKWDGDKIEGHFKNLMELSEEALNNKFRGINLIIWPETASVRSMLFKAENLTSFKKLLPENSKNYLLTGLLDGYRDNDQIVYTNSLAVFGPGQVLIDKYDKHHLVPFGEYIPFGQYIPIDPIVNFSGFQAGPGLRRIKVTDSLTISPLICYEIIFSGQTTPWRIPKRYKPNLIVNITNDAWYGDSAGPRQHLVQAQYRAIESGLSVVRVANTGISALISPLGGKLTEIPYGKRGYQSHPLILPLQNETYFAKFGHKISFALFLLIALGIYAFKKKR